MIILLASLFLLVAAGHPFYLSVTSLSYNEDEKSLQGSVKVFSSDLESALGRLSGKKIDLLHPADSLALFNQVRAYLETRLRLKSDQKYIPLHFLGFEHQEEATWLYIEFRLNTKPGRVELENTLLYDFLTGQINIIQVEIGGKEQSGRVTNPHKYLEFLF